MHCRRLERGPPALMKSRNESSSRDRPRNTNTYYTVMFGTASSYGKPVGTELRQLELVISREVDGMHTCHRVLVEHAEDGARVASVLGELGVATLPSNNPGRLKAQSLTATKVATKAESLVPVELVAQVEAIRDGQESQDVWQPPKASVRRESARAAAAPGARRAAARTSAPRCCARAPARR